MESLSLCYILLLADLALCSMLGCVQDSKIILRNQTQQLLRGSEIFKENRGPFHFQLNLHFLFIFAQNSLACFILLKSQLSRKDSPSFFISYKVLKMSIPFVPTAQMMKIVHGVDPSDFAIPLEQIIPSNSRSIIPLVERKSLVAVVVFLNPSSTIPTVEAC